MFVGAMNLLPSKILLLFALAATVVYAQRPALTLSFPEDPNSNNIVYDNFIGISWELSSFDTLWGRTQYTLPNPMLNYMSNVRARMDHPLRIRIGGSGMDGSTYIPDKHDTMLEITDDSFFNDISVNFGPVFFEVLNAMQSSVGSMQFIVGLSMRDPENYENVIQLAEASERYLGDSLDAMLLGNEPDLYPGRSDSEPYTIDVYLSELRGMVGHLQDANLLPEPLLGGPTVCCSWRISDLINSGLGDLNYKYYTLQHYPTHACDGENEVNTNISYFLTHSEIETYLLDWNQDGVNLAKEQGVPVLLSEYNSVACGGSSISNTFTMSLWLIDVGLKAIATNYSSVYLHTREYGRQYNLFDPPYSSLSSASDANLTTWTTGASYYALLFMAESISSNGSVIIDLNLESGNRNTSATVAGYAIYDNEGADRSKMVLINYNHDPSIDNSTAPEVEASSSEAAQVFMIPGGISDTVHYRMLSAPSIWETTRISWAGQTVGENGRLDESPQHTEMVECASGCQITVPGPGATLVFFSNETIYIGNATIVDAGGDMSNGEGNSASLNTPYWIGVLVPLVWSIVTSLVE